MYMYMVVDVKWKRERERDTEKAPKEYWCVYTIVGCSGRVSSNKHSYRGFEFRTSGFRIEDSGFRVAGYDRGLWD